ncbi:penicillin-binding protein activator [Hydrocarboniphaga sp.]|uniref:penicillin-binding protein activator n=1 Tax=Hydrocarboniphaga sp. TaxID=2033016 RepID=UPI002AB8FC3F|nr:penicillin-binding protein activator [Hydrocarboniphaga sp.]MDZ4081023.1 penicillin-binding protein activator [Hydrocarboniphaga sp.]
MLRSRLFSASLFGLSLALASARGTSSAAADPQPAAEQALTAAEAAINTDNDKLAETWLSRIPAGSLTMPQMARAQIVRADILLKRGQPMPALQTLPSSSDHVPLYAAQIEQLRAQALFALGDPVAAVRALVQRERFLQNDPAALAENRDQIWNGLMRNPPEANDLPKFAAQNTATRGWLELFQNWRQGSMANYNSWSAKFPGHPGNARIAGFTARPAQTPAVATPAAPSPLASAPSAALPPGAANGFSAAPAPAGYPPVSAPAPISNAPLQVYAGNRSGNGIALLVPLSGPLAATGEAVRVGFMAAANKGGAGGGIRVYDSGADASQAIGAYQTALSEGAGVIVGPLVKEAVAALARMGPPAVPLLALNALDANQPAPANFLQFGLAPEDEARAAATQAIAQNRRRALALVPSSEWGNRVLIAFREQFTSLGGTVVSAEAFQSGSPDPSKVVKKLMALDASEGRHKALTAVLGKNTEFDARRREDVDFIFLAAKPSDSYLILPQLRFYRASGLPIVSTSLIYEGRGIDWQRMSVCDMPWMLETQGQWAQARSEAAAMDAGPMRDYPRLVALGGDAFRVANRLLANNLHAGDRIDGASGRLVIGGDGRIARELGCSAPMNTAVASSAP